MDKKIYVSKRDAAHLRKVFGCSKVMVWKALNFKSDSDLAQKIRYTAPTGNRRGWKQPTRKPSVQQHKPLASV